MVPTAVLFCFWHGTAFWRHCTGSVQSSLWWKHNGKIIDKLSCVFNGSRTFAMFNRAWRKPPEKTRRCGDISFFFLCHILKKKQVSSCFFGHLPWREGNFTFLEGWSKMRSLAGSERCILWEKTTANRSGRLWKHPRSLGCPWCYLLSACVIAFFILYCDEDSVRKCIFLFIIRCRRVFECTNRVYLEQLYLYAFVVPRCTC